MKPFDRFVAVDWSGAAGRSYPGIAVAQCRPGTGSPTLIRPQERNWRRTDFVEWLAGETFSEDRVLVGIDCAFALPGAAGQKFLGRPYAAPELWEHIDRACAAQSDYYGGSYAREPAHAGQFWHAGPRPSGFAELHREAELACRAAGHGVPESPLKLVGARQVGKGGLAGMRVLSHLKRRMGEDFAVWPFDGSERADIVCVELYPRLFLRAAGHGSGKIRNIADLDRTLAALGSDSYGDQTAILTDHETDALAAAAGLRGIADRETLWNPAGLTDLARRTEGWIFGVA
jgi:hypothetical protein